MPTLFLALPLARRTLRLSGIAGYHAGNRADVVSVTELELVHFVKITEVFEAYLCLSANVCQMLSSFSLEGFLKSRIKRKRLFKKKSHNLRVDGLCKSVGKEFAQHFSSLLAWRRS